MQVRVVILGSDRNACADINDNNVSGIQNFAKIWPMTVCMYNTHAILKYKAAFTTSGQSSLSHHPIYIPVLPRHGGLKQEFSQLVNAL